MKTALITGAARRVGKDIALFLAHNGWNIALHCRTVDADTRKLEKKLLGLGVNVVLIEAELSDAAAVKKIIPQAKKALGAVTLLINNAAVFEKDTLKNLTPASFALHMQVNLLAPILLSQDFCAQLPARAQGNIINMLDSCEGWSISPDFLSYSLSKQSLEYFTQLMVGVVAPSVRVNAIAPGPTLPGKQDKKDTFAKLAASAPLKRTSSPAEICAAIVFILQSDSLTGQVIALGGGLGALPAKSAI